MTILTKREEWIGYQHNRLRRKARDRHPRTYLSGHSHREESKSIAREKCADFLIAMSRPPELLDVADIVSTLNYVAPDDCQIVSRDDFDEIRTYAVALWKLLDEVVACIESKSMSDPYGKIIDLVRNAQRFDSQFREAELNMPDVVANTSH